MLQQIKAFLSPENRRTIGEEAKQALGNKHWKEAFEAMDGYLLDAARQCDPDNREKAQRGVIALQIMEGLKRELHRKVQDGEMAQVELSEIEARKTPRRFLRGM